MRSWAVVNIEPGTLNFELLYMVCDEKGMMLERETAGPYGDGKTAGISKHGLSSNMFDADTGLYYFAARWYAPDTGRFLQMDPVITETGLINMYDYCNNNPLNITDRYGEFWSLSEMWHGVKEIFGGNRVKRAYSEGDKTGDPQPQARPGPQPWATETPMPNQGPYYTDYNAFIDARVNAGLGAIGLIPGTQIALSLISLVQLDFYRAGISLVPVAAQIQSGVDMAYWAGMESGIIPIPLKQITPTATWFPGASRVQMPEHTATATETWKR